MVSVFFFKTVWHIAVAVAWLFQGKKKCLKTFGSAETPPLPLKNIFECFLKSIPPPPAPRNPMVSGSLLPANYRQLSPTNPQAGRTSYTGNLVLLRIFCCFNEFMCSTVQFYPALFIPSASFLERALSWPGPIEDRQEWLQDTGAAIHLQEESNSGV